MPCHPKNKLFSPTEIRLCFMVILVLVATLIILSLHAKRGGVAKSWLRLVKSFLLGANKKEIASSRKIPMKRRFFLILMTNVALTTMSFVAYGVSDKRCRAGIGNLYHHTVADVVVLLVKYDGLVLFGAPT